jgi:NAD(P)-dependent dehydrogenase (short-subunit alcohol dehydrogenase family)
MVQTSAELHAATAGWTERDIPDLTGRRAVVTGASSGIGLEIARRLAARGAHVTLAARDLNRTRAAAHRITSAVPGADVEVALLDLANLASVRRFARTIRDRHDRLDLLVNNAGTVGGPRRETADGFEMHFGVNHLGHFALTGLLLPLLLAEPTARVVTMSSGLAAQSRLDFDDLQSRHRYRMATAYGRSKLANLLFAVELHRRTRDARPGLLSLACHPGVARTNLFVGRSADWGRGRRAPEYGVRLVQLLFGQSPATAARPALFQATGPTTPGSYVGTRGHLRGRPAPAPYPPEALDPDAARRLWQLSVELTRVEVTTAGTR